MKKQVKVLIAKPGLDGHDRGVKFLARFLKEHGVQVIYTGLRKTPSQIALIAYQEDVDVVILHNLTGAHNHLFVKTVDELKKHKISPKVIGWGIIPKQDKDYLLSKGVNYVFGAGAKADDFLDIINNI